MEYKGKQPSRQTGMLQSILSYPLDVANLNSSLERWEWMVKQWETSTGKILDDTSQICIAMKAMPEELSLSQYLVLNSARFTAYAALRHEIVEIVTAQRALQGPTAMDVGALSKASGKGTKGKSKGKDGEVVCFTCGRPGHRSSECWWNREGEKGKASGKGGSSSSSGGGASSCVAQASATTARSRDTRILPQEEDGHRCRPTCQVGGGSIAGAGARGRRPLSLCCGEGCQREAVRSQRGHEVLRGQLRRHLCASRVYVSGPPFGEDCTKQG